MYVWVSERPELLQDIEGQKRALKELGGRVALVKEKIEKPFNPFLGEVLPQGVLKRAGFTTERWADGKASALIQAALEQSRVLRPFVANKLGQIAISKNYDHYETDKQFEYKYVKLHSIHAPEGQRKALTASFPRVFPPPHGLDSPSAAHRVRPGPH